LKYSDLQLGIFCDKIKVVLSLVHWSKKFSGALISTEPKSKWLSIRLVLPKLMEHSGFQRGTKTLLGPERWP